MKDRLALKKYELKNGLTLYHFPSDAPYVTARYVIPFGSGHNTNDIIPGTFHFLEHIILKRSKLYPDYREWSKKVGLVGGYSNASTSRNMTQFIVSVPNEHTELIDGLLSHVLEPLFETEDTEKEKSIIQNERKGKERWFPGADEISHYLWTEWLDEAKDYLYQRLGSDENLASIDAAYLETIHKKYYFNKNSFLIVGGDLDVNPLIEKLESITPTVEAPEFQKRTIAWKDKSYREVSFTDANRYTYRIGGIIEKDFKKNLIARFGMVLLINNVHGYLYNWLRHEKNWVYGVNFETDTNYENAVWQISVPLSHPEHVEEVRQSIKSKIKEAFSDENLIASEKRRFLGQQKFQFETTNEVIDFILGWYGNYGVIITEHMLGEIINGITSEDLLALLDNEIGEILTIPKGETH